MFKVLSYIAAVSFLCMSAAMGQSRPGEDKELGEMQCFAVLVIAASGAKKPDQKFFEKPDFHETVAECNSVPASCRQIVDEIKEHRWPIPPGLSCGG
jgi:hypothetical protein